MSRKSAVRVAVVAAAACVAVLGFSVVGASAGATQIDPTGVAVDLGPAPVPLSGSCPFSQGGDASLYFLNGHAVMYGTVNKNGDWGGGNLEGTAVFLDDGTPYYVGHVHFWFGGGNNIQGQSESGYTLSYKGTGLSDPSQTLSMNLSGGYAQPAHSTSFSTFRNHGTITCG